MESLLIGSIFLQGYNELYSYPFVNRYQDGVRVSIINENNELETFCEIPQLYHFFKEDCKQVGKYFIYYVTEEKDERNHTTAFSYHIRDKAGNEKVLVQPYPDVHSKDITVLADNYLLCRGKILHLEDLSQIMEIPLPKTQGNPGIHCEFCMHLEEDNYLICYKGIETILVIVDLYNKVIVKQTSITGSLEDIQVNADLQIYLTIRRKRATAANTRELENVICVLDKDLHLQREFGLGEYVLECYMDFATQRGYGETVSGKGCIYQYNIETGEREEVTIPGYRDSWYIIGASNGILYFELSAKKVGAYSVSDGKMHTFTFKMPVTRSFMMDGKCFAVSGADGEDYMSKDPLHKGLLEVYCIIDENN